MIIHIVMFKLKTQPLLVESTQPGTFTDATATSAIQATQDEINVYQEKVMEEIAAALKQVPGPLTPMHLGPPLLSERAKGWNFGIYARFKDRAALRAYDVSEAHQSVVNSVIKPHIDDFLDYDFEVPDEV